MVKKAAGSKGPGVYRMTPIDRVAARVLPGRTKQTPPNLENLRAKATRATNPEKKRKLLERAVAAEKAAKRSKAAKKAAASRMVSTNAVERARKALEAAKWKRENRQFRQKSLSTRGSGA